MQPDSSGSQDAVALNHIETDSRVPCSPKLPYVSAQLLGILCGAFMLATAVVPWGFDSEGPLWPWTFISTHYLFGFKSLLIGAWLCGAFFIATSLWVKGKMRTIAQVGAGTTVLILAALQASTPLAPFVSFLPLPDAANPWLQILTLMALAVLWVDMRAMLRGAAVSWEIYEVRLAAILIVGAVVWQVVAGSLRGQTVTPPVALLVASMLFLLGMGFAVFWLKSTTQLANAMRASRGLILAGAVAAGFGMLVENWLRGPTGSFLFANAYKTVIVGCAALVVLEGCGGMGAILRRAVLASGAAAALVATALHSPTSPPPPTQFVASAQAQSPISAEAAHHVRKGDWSQWCGGPDRNMVSDETGLPERFEGFAADKTTGLTNVRWVVPLGRRVLGSPVVANGKVYVGGSLSENGEDIAMLWCFRVDDGALLWRMRSPYIRMLYNASSFGTCSTPTVEKDRLYMLNHLGDVLCLGADGLGAGNKGPFTDEAKYFASGRQRTNLAIAPDGQRIIEYDAGKPAELSAQDADILWRYDLIGGSNCWPFNALNAAIIVRGERLYVSTCSVYSKPSFGPESSKIPIDEWKQKTGRKQYDSPSLIVLDKRTGKLLARDHEGIFDETFHGANSSPALGVAGGREMLVYGAGNGVCYAFDPNFAPGTDNNPGTLKPLWKFNCVPEGISRAEVIASPVIYKDRVYVSIGNDLSQSFSGAGPERLVCINARGSGDVTGSGLVWSFDSIRSSASTVAIADGLLYTGDAAGNIYCLDADTGKLHWKHKAAGAVWSSPLLADGKVYIGVCNRGMLVFAHSREKILLSENLPRANIVGSPAIANGVLYVASQTHLYALEAGKSGDLKESK